MALRLGFDFSLLLSPVDEANECVPALAEIEAIKSQRPTIALPDIEKLRYSRLVAACPIREIS
jgi:hypothetical protein